MHALCMLFLQRTSNTASLWKGGCREEESGLEVVNAEKVVSECTIVFFVSRGEQLAEQIRDLDKLELIQIDGNPRLWVDIDFFGIKVTEEMKFVNADTMCLRFSPVEGQNEIRIIGEPVMMNVINRGSGLSQFFLEWVVEFLHKNRCKFSIIKI